MAPEPPAVREGRQRAEFLRYSLKLGDAPIRDLFGFIQRTWPELMLIRKNMPTGPAGALVAKGGRWLIVVNTHDQPLARQRFTAMHEVGHHQFDAQAGDDLHVDDDMRAHGRPIEMRANAFAVHFLLPDDALSSRIGAGQLDVNDDEEIVALAFEYGLSTTSLAWHLYNGGHIDRGRCDQLLNLRPWSIAARSGLADRVEREQAAKFAETKPRRFVGLAMQAHAQDKLTRTDIQRLLGPQATDLLRALDEEPDGE